MDILYPIKTSEQNRAWHEKETDGHLVKKAVCCLKKKNYLANCTFAKIRKQTNPLFKDESRNKITFKRHDFYSATAFRNLKRVFISVRAIIS